MAWHGHLAIDYDRDERGGTRARSRHHGPMRVLAGLYPEGPAVCHHVLVHPPGGLVGGMPTMRVMPAKLPPPPEAWWQATQLPAMPAWFMREFAKRAPSTTGSVAIEDPVPTWQASHDAFVGMWFEGRPTMAKPLAGIANEGAAAPWHCAQFVVVLGALAWMSVRLGITA